MVFRDVSWRLVAFLGGSESPGVPGRNGGEDVETVVKRAVFW